MNDAMIKTAPLSAASEYGYIPGLDGLRAISVLIVIIAHMGLEHIVPGGFGVTVFFFISGFLITRLLIAEHEKKGRIGLKDFYIRRFVRLYPALLFMVFVTAAAYMLIGWGGPKLMEMISAVFYGTNIYQVSVRAGGELPFMPWTHLWSLAVEEHFYLVFPLFMVAMNGRWRRAALGLSAVIGLVLLWRFIILTQTNLDPNDYSYMMTDARLDSLAWGCLLSVLLHHLKDAAKLRWLIGYIPTALGIIAILASFVIRDEMFRFTLRFSVQGVALFVLVLNLYFFKPLRFAFSILEFKPLAWFGMVSYALYLWHVPVIDMCVRSLGDSVSSKLIALPISIALAAISFYIVEKPFIALRKKFGSHIIRRPDDKAHAQTEPAKPAAL